MRFPPTATINVDGVAYTARADDDWVRLTR